MLLEPARRGQHVPAQGLAFGRQCVCFGAAAWVVYVCRPGGCSQSTCTLCSGCCCCSAQPHQGALAGLVPFHATAACPLPAVHGVRCQQIMHQTVCLYIQVLHLFAALFSWTYSAPGMSHVRWCGRWWLPQQGPHTYLLAVQQQLLVSPRHCFYAACVALYRQLWVSLGPASSAPRWRNLLMARAVGGWRIPAW